MLTYNQLLLIHHYTHQQKDQFRLRPPVAYRSYKMVGGPIAKAEVARAVREPIGGLLYIQDPYPVPAGA